jgi:L-ascorbate metabolism protein UlaG (beta-lactamase superfamily)
MTTTHLHRAAGLTIQVIGGPTAVLELGGLRLLTDPTFDPPGEYLVGGRTLTKLLGPAVPLDRVGAVDAVLLSHDQHADNLDRSGRAYLAEVPLVLTTRSAAGRLGAGVTALPPWSHIDLTRPDGQGDLRITAVPAQHGPDGTEHIVGEVTGFVLTATDLPTVYVSGDNASLDVVREVAGRFPRIDLALLFAGAARTPLLGEANLTLDSRDAVAAARILYAGRVVPLHVEGWQHFTEGPELFRRAFVEGGLGDRLVAARAGEPMVLGRRPAATT